MTGTKAVPGRYTVQITATVYASNRREAYRMVESALSRRNNGVEFQDAEDIKIEPYCVHVDAGFSFEDARDLAEPGSALCASCQKGVRLTKDDRYNVAAVEGDLIGWSGSHEGYNLDHYFDKDGRYLGADAHGVEPLFNVQGATNQWRAS